MTYTGTFHMTKRERWSRTGHCSVARLCCMLVFLSWLL